ncbi:hypothetical protein EIP91_009326 [Steccherinum ochraceum]|uniref:F-box domain-containing protein n=1 Tax=Steccherinum ochraceum TaxID=92696 RepID=A0A4R0RMS2_9APHY|nr:hypothetical protein EIP91_009326 [Steccherinum ochraceum]
MHVDVVSDGSEFAMANAALLDVIWKTPARVASLSFRLLPAEMHRTIASMHSIAEFPKLRTLELYAPPTPSNSRLVLSQCLTKLVVPALKTLKVDGYPADFHCGCDVFPRTLTCLFIRSRSVAQSTVSDVIKVLRSLTLLQELQLHDAMSEMSRPDADPPSLPPVPSKLTLPYLRRVVINDECVTSVHLLDHLVVPVDANITLSLQYCDQDVIHLLIAPILAKLSTATDRDDARQAIESLSIYEDKITFRKRIPRNAVWTSPLPEITLQVCDDGLEFANGAFLDKFAAKLPLADVTELSILGYDFTDTDAEEALRTIVRTLVNLERVAFNGVSNSMTFPQVLSTVHCCSPTLRSISLQHIDFRMDNNRLRCDDFVPLLRKNAQTRREEESAIQEIEIKHCPNVTSWDVKLLKEVVETIVWDVADD